MFTIILNYVRIMSQHVNCRDLAIVQNHTAKRHSLIIRASLLGEKQSAAREGIHTAFRFLLGNGGIFVSHYPEV